jgi:diadenosine tetraphosphate (Ap4A) HIT family hydrolase
MFSQNCIACDTITGNIQSPGGLVTEDTYWQVDHALSPIFIRGQLIIKLKRHCENLSDLTSDEADSLGPLIRQVCHALQVIMCAEKVHVASYGEGISHVHFIVTPRTKELPPSNIRLTMYLTWRRLLYQLGMKGLARSEGEATEIVKQVREALCGERNN